MNRELMQDLRGYLADVLVDRVEPCFKKNERMKITLLCRNEGYPDGSRDVVVTNEKDIEEAVKALRILNQAPPERTFNHGG